MSNLATIVNNILADSGIDDINVIVSTGSYANPAWITSLAWTKITGAPTIVGSVTASSPLFSSGGTSPNLTIQQASGSQNGFLSSTDWTTFNNKQDLITAGTTAQYYRGDKTFQTLNTAAVPELTNLYFTTARVLATALTGYTVGTNTSLAATDTILGAFGKVQAQINAKGSGTVTSVAALTLGTTGTDLSSSVATGTTTPVITLNVPSASAANRGVLTAADWTTFNNKQNALTNPVTGTGVAGQVAYWSSASAITGENNLFWDATNNRLDVIGTSYISVGAGIGVTANFINSGPILTATLTNGGSGYVDATYTDVAVTTLSTTSGVYALFTIVVSGGIVTTATLTWGGTAYRVGDTLTVSNTLLGGTGSGLVITVATVDSSELIIADSIGGDITLYRNDTSLSANDNIGSIKFEGRDSSSKASGVYAKIGAGAAGTGGGAYLYFSTASGSGGALTERLRLTSGGTVIFSNLGGVGTRMVVADANGLLSTQAITVGTVTSVAALTLGTTGTDLTSTVANGTTTPVITLNVPNASATNRGALTAADWTTFNSKQNALTNPVTGTGTTNTLPKFTGASTIGNSNIQDSGTLVSVGVAANFSENVTITASTGNSPLRFTSTTASSKIGYLYADASIIGITDTLNAGASLDGIFFNSTTRQTSFFNNGTISLAISSTGILSLYNSAGTFFSSLSNAPTANRTITIPDATGTILISNSVANTAGYFDSGTTTPTGTTRLNYSGYLYPTFLNLTGSGDTATAATHYFVETASDGFVRPKTLANVRTEVVGGFTGNLSSTALPYATISSTASDFKVAFLNTTGNASGNFGLLHDSTASFLYNPSTNLLTAGNYYATDGTRQVFLNPSADFGSGSNPTVQGFSNHALQFATNNGLRATITAGGNFLIGTPTDNGNKLRVNGTGFFDDDLRTTLIDSEEIIVTLGALNAWVNVKTFGTTEKKVFIATVVATSTNKAGYAYSVFSKAYDGTNSNFVRSTIASSDISIDRDSTTGVLLRVQASGSAMVNEQVKVKILYLNK